MKCMRGKRLEVGAGRISAQRVARVMLQMERPAPSCHT